MKELDQESDVSRDIHVIPFILSALLHLLLIFLLLTMHYLQQQRSPSAQTQEAQELDFDNALILAQSPQKQASVIFQNAPPVTTPAPQQPDDQPAQEAEEHDTKSDSIKAEQTASLVQPNAHELDESQPFAAPITSQQSLPTESIVSEGIKNDLKKLSAPRKRRKRTKKKAVSLKDITNGFLKSMYQEQGLTPKTNLDAQEMARNSYKTKIWTAIRQSSHFTNRSIHLFNDVSGLIQLVLTLNKNGSLKDVHCSLPSQHPDLEHVAALLQKIVRNVGLFPPIPRSFNAETTTFRFPIYAQCHAGTHDYTLSYGNP